MPQRPGTLAGLPGGLPRRPRRGGGEEEDRISSLPDDLLLQILARLRCARAAALTGLLARRWRGLWTRLPELAFRHTAPNPLDPALAQLAAYSYPALRLSLLDIRVYWRQALASAGVASLFRAAAGLAPEKLSLFISGNWRAVADAVPLPCFDDRTVSIFLHVHGIRLALPPAPAGRFQALQSLSLIACSVDLAGLLPLCPRLRKLRLLVWAPSISVHSPSLEELDVECGTVQRIDILTPSLKKLKFRGFNGFDNEFSLTYSAPIVEELSWDWKDPYLSTSDRFGIVWLSNSLKLRSLEACRHRLFPNNNRDNTCLQPQHCPRVHILSLKILRGLFDAIWSFEQMLSHIPVTRFSILKLDIERNWHVYGPMVLHLLRLCTFIQRLELKLSKVEDEECAVNCPCEQPNNWRSQNLSLTNLKEVDIQGFKGKDHEIDLLKVIFRSATMLQRVTVKLSSNVSTRDGYMGIQSILEAYPSVGCKIYCDSGACLVDTEA